MSMNDLPVTGLVLHFRTPDKTFVCIRSLVDEGVKKVIVVDNSEDKGSSLVPLRKALELIPNDVDIIILEPGRNLGFSAGVDYGFNHGYSGEGHVLLINSDARLNEGALSPMVEMLEDAHIIAPLIGQMGEEPSSAFYYYDKLLATITRLPKISPVLYASGCCLLIKNGVYDGSLFDQDFFFYGEDIFLGFSVNKMNIKVKECGQAIVSHKTSSSSKNGSMFYEYHINRAHWLLAKKIANNNLERLLFIMTRLAALPLRASIRCLRYKTLNAWRGLIMATIDSFWGRIKSLTPPVTDHINNPM